MAENDRDYGIEDSYSNRRVRGRVTVVKPNVSHDYSTSATQAGDLESHSIASIIIDENGTVRLWGGVSDTTSTDYRRYVGVGRIVDDIMRRDVESIPRVMIDRKLGDDFVGRWCNEVDSRLATRVGRGHISGGNCTADTTISDPTRVGVVVDLEVYLPARRLDTTARIRAATAVTV